MSDCTCDECALWTLRAYFLKALERNSVAGAHIWTCLKAEMVLAPSRWAELRQTIDKSGNVVAVMTNLLGADFYDPTARNEHDESPPSHLTLWLADNPRPDHGVTKED